MISQANNTKRNIPLTCATARGANRTLSRLRRWPVLGVIATGALLLLVGTVYAAVQGSVSVWIWAAVLGAVAGGWGAVLWPGPKAAAPPIPARTIVQEVNLRGVRVVVGSDGAEAFRVSLYAVPLTDDTAGFIVLVSEDAPGADAVKRKLEELLADSSSQQEAETRFLRALDDQCDVEYALVGLWQESRRVLVYFALGFESPVVMNIGWPHRSEVAIDRRTDRGLQKVSFGIHRLSSGERWLFYTPPLVAVPDPQREPFNSVGLVQYAHNGWAMSDDLWVDHLLELGLKAHDGALPKGSLLISLACKRSASVASPNSPRPHRGAKVPVTPRRNSTSTTDTRWRPHATR